MLRKADDFDPKRFRASQIPPSNRLDAWRQVLNTWLLSADIRPVTSRPFHGNACLRVSPEVRFGWGTLDATLNIRTRQLTAQDNDDLFLFMPTGGRMVVTQSNREVSVPVRGGYLMSCAEPGAYNWPDGIKLLALRTPIAPVSALVRNVYDCLARPIAPNNEALRLLIDYVRLLTDSDSLEAISSQELVTRHMQDLLALALGAMNDAKEVASGRGLQAARWELAVAYIERYLVEPWLCAESVSRHLCISERSLQRLFELRDTTFTEYVLSRRLAKAHAALGDPNEAASSISDLAIACGFSNISYFNRSFRKRYRASPSEVKCHETSRHSDSSP